MSGAAFGPDRSWLAVRVSDPELLRAAFGFERLERASPSEGLAAVGAARAFVTPPIGAWTLVVVDRPSADELARLACRVSSQLAEAQAFVCRGGARHFAWIVARDGKLERAFELARGRVRRDEGERRQGEPEDTSGVDESALLNVAESFSVDPSALAFKSDLGQGFIAHFPATKTARGSFAKLLPRVLGGSGIVLIEIAAVLAFGRLFAHVERWWLAAALGLLVAAYAWISPPGARLKRPALLFGVALALGALVGGAFPAQPID